MIIVIRQIFLSVLISLFLWTTLGCKTSNNKTNIQESSSKVNNSAAFIEKSTSEYNIKVNLENPPLETGKESLTIKIKTLKGQPVEKATFDVVMSMEGHGDMTAPLSFKPSPEPGTYSIEPEFTMPGEWIIKVKPTASSEAISIPVEVQ